MKKMPHFIVNILPIFLYLYLACKVILCVFNYFTSCKFMWTRNNTQKNRAGWFCIDLYLTSHYLNCSFVKNSATMIVQFFSFENPPRITAKSTMQAIVPLIKISSWLIFFLPKVKELLLFWKCIYLKTMLNIFLKVTALNLLL